MASRTGPASRQGIKNKLGLTTIYIPKAKRNVWIVGHGLAENRGLSMSEYVVRLIEEDAKKSGIKIS